MVTNALLKAQALYPGYSLVFLFDNAINYSIYTKEVLCIGDMNKSLGGKQPYLHNG